MSRHCWVIEVPTKRGGWKVEDTCVHESTAHSYMVWLRELHPRARIVKYTPEVEDDTR